MPCTAELADVERSLGGRYRVLRQLGKGGMARVYEVRLPDADEPLAAKILHPELVAMIARDRFLREIQISSRLSHPNILSIRASGETSDSLYYVMPLIAGGTLRDRLDRETQLAVPDVLSIAAAMCAALDYATAHGVVHRDVKPENILIEHDGTPVLADFGIARALDQAAGSRLTYSQFVLGTPVYMSPEQHEPDSVLDGRSDQYSLAVMLYELLAGSPPYTGKTPHVILARKTLEPMPALRPIRREIPLGLERALARALAVTPADRFPSNADFCSALSVVAERSHWRGPFSVTLGAASIAALALAGVLYLRPENVPTPALRRVAVLPFENTTGDTSLSVVGVMAADWISEGLARTGVVEVTPTHAVLESRTAASRARSVPESDALARAGRILRANILVTGRIYLLRDSLRFLTQITDLASQKQLGAIPAIVIDRRDPMRGIDQLRDRVMGFLASALDARLSRSVGAGAVPPLYDAYRSFSRGLEEYTRNDFRAAEALFLTAIRADSTFALPLLFASISASNLGDFATADSLIHRMREQSETLSPVHRAWLSYRERLLAGDRAGALDAVRQLAALSPGTKAVDNHATEAYENGFYAEAIAAIKTLDMDDGFMRDWAPGWDLLGACYHQLRNYAAEEHLGVEVERRFPSRMYALLPKVRSLAAQARLSELSRVLDAARALPSDPYGTSVGDLTVEAAREVAAHVGPAAAIPLLRRARDWYRSEAPTRTVVRAWVEHQLGADSAAASLLAEYVRSDSAAPESIGLAGVIAWSVGDSATAETFAQRLANSRRPYGFGESRLALAGIEAARGRHQAAIAALARGFREGLAYGTWLHTTPEFRAILNDPEYKIFLRGREARSP